MKLRQLRKRPARGGQSTPRLSDRDVPIKIVVAGPSIVESTATGEWAGVTPIRIHANVRARNFIGTRIDWIAPISRAEQEYLDT